MIVMGKHRDEVNIDFKGGGGGDYSDVYACMHFIHSFNI
jgi:hypothetical protein